MRKSNHTCLAVLLLLPYACGDAELQVAQPSVRDSAGIEIYETVDPWMHPMQYHLEDTPSVRIGVAEGPDEYQLFQVRGARSLSDGSILVLNAGTHQVRRYDSHGVWLSSFGRKGRGPGELDFPVRLLAAGGDTTLLYDMGVGRVYLLDRLGQVIGSHSGGRSLSGFVGMLDSTTAIVADLRSPSRGYDQIVTNQVVVMAVDINSGRSDTVEIVPGWQDYRYTRGELVRSARVPFTDMPAVGVMGGTVYVVEPASQDIRVYGRDRQLLRIIRPNVIPDTVDDAAWDRAVAFWSRIQAGFRGEARLTPAEVNRQKEIYQSMPRPRRMPFYGGISLDDDGGIWLRKYTEPGRVQQWVRIDPQGAATATLEVPPSVLVWEIGSSGVLGLRGDSIGVEYIARYPFRTSH